MNEKHFEAMLLANLLADKYGIKRPFAVCAWCKPQSVYDAATGKQLDRLTPAQFAEIDSHGICQECKAAQLAETRARKNPCRRRRNQSAKGKNRRGKSRKSI